MQYRMSISQGQHPASMGTMIHIFILLIDIFYGERYLLCQYRNSRRSVVKIKNSNLLLRRMKQYPKHKESGDAEILKLND